MDRLIQKALELTGNAAATKGRRPRHRAVQTTAARDSDWLTATEAAKLLMRDTPGLGLAKARSRVSTAAGKGRFESVGIRRSRRIEPKSFDSWRLKQRDRSLDQQG